MSHHTPPKIQAKRGSKCEVKSAAIEKILRSMRAKEASIKPAKQSARPKN